MNKTISYDFPSIGCYLDGANAQDYNDFRVIRMAENYGYEVSEEYAEHLRLEVLEPYEFLNEESDSAIEFLNELEIRSYHYWGWHDGDFGLSINVEGAKEDIDDVFNDLSEVSLDFEGEFLLVNDHGNVSFYVRTHKSIDNGVQVTDKLIWDVV